jgi:hypothetical protein
MFINIDTSRVAARSSSAACMMHSAGSRLVQAFGPLHHLPQSFSGKGMARPRLEIAFERSRLNLIRERHIRDEAPRQKLGGMRRLAGVVLGKAALQIGRQADVALVGVAFALKEIDIEHVIPLGSPSFAKASEGILLRATALQGLFCVVRSAKQNGGWGVLHPFP